MSYFRAKQADGTIVKVPLGRKGENGHTPIKGIDGDSIITVNEPIT